MRYADVKPGMKVLVNSSRPGTRYWSLASCEMAEVLATGLSHNYRVQAGGWDYRWEDRHTDQGIKLHVWRHDRNRHTAGDDTPLPAEYEDVTIAAHLIPAEGEKLETWRAMRSRLEAQATLAAAIEQEKQELADRFEAEGYKITFDAAGNVVMARDEAAKMLRWLS